MARRPTPTQETLDRRRHALLKRTHTADVADRKLAEIGRALEANERQTAQREADLRAALGAVAALKKALKADKKQRKAIRASRKEARTDAARHDAAPVRRR